MVRCGDRRAFAVVRTFLLYIVHLRPSLLATNVSVGVAYSALLRFCEVIG